ncbi:unnamed protein product, partial [Oppiella nova]
MGKTTVGQIVNLMSNDVNRLMTAQLTDNRLRYMVEIISGMRVIKMYAWEQPFDDLVANARKQEVGYIKRSCFLKAINMSLFNTATKLILFAAFITYVLTGHVLTAKAVFVSMMLFNTLRVNMTWYFPQAIAMGAEMLVSCRRIQTFLELEEIQLNSTKISNSVELNTSGKQTPELSVNNISAKWSEDSPYPTLHNISAHLKPGDLLAVIGPVGAGKTSFLMTLLNELPVLEGSIQTVGTISYASQEPWSFNNSVRNNILFGSEYDEHRYKQVVHVCALERDLQIFPFGDKTLVGEKGVSLSGGQKARITLARYGIHGTGSIQTVGTISYASQEPWSFNNSVRNNILFGSEYDEHRYRQVVHVCALERDLQIFPFGDKTLVGEKGVSLSGGQKARITLARALYRNSDIVLMDDPLSAVDTSVAEHIFDKCIVEYLSDKIRILVTHQIQFIRKATQILVLSPEGRCLGLGSYDELQSQGLDFMKLLSDQDMDATKQQERDLMRTLSQNSYDTKITSRTASDDVMDGQYSGDPKIQDENRELGSISGRVYWKYIRAGAGPLLFSVTLFFTLVSQAIFHGSDYYLTEWTDSNQENTNSDTSAQNNGVIIYSSLMGALFMTSLLRAITWFVMFMRASVNLHNSIFYRLLRAPIAVFDNNPVGRILNRFTKDLARSPVYSHVSTTLSGLASVRAYGAQEMFEQQYYVYQDDHSATWILSITANRSFGLIMDWLCVGYIVVIFAVLMIYSDGLKGGEAGLAFSSALMLTGMTQWGVRQSAELESQMTSVERIIEYSKLPQEAPLDSDDRHRPPPDWPSKGQIELRNMSLVYEGSTKPVLKNLCCSVKSGEKIGIVGRTGAGKSSIISALFRMVEPRGEVVVDGVDTKSIGLHDLRRNISIIPQDPVVFTGPVRRNLDPFGEYTDDLIWSALEEVQLRHAVQDLPGQLDGLLSEGGGNLSVGQRQLVCLARAILRHNRLLVLDEATANVDHRTDALIQTTIRHKFSDRTVLTIAHRLNTIIDCDRVLVLDAGEIVEFDEPFALLQRRGQLYDMCRKT